MLIMNNLREFREKAGIAIAELSRESEVSDTIISSIETEPENNSRKTTKYKILNALNKLTGQNLTYEEVYPEG